LTGTYKWVLATADVYSLVCDTTPAVVG
jgi:hypothetical protein